MTITKEPPPTAPPRIEESKYFYPLEKQEIETLIHIITEQLPQAHEALQFPQPDQETHEEIAHAITYSSLHYFLGDQLVDLESFKTVAQDPFIFLRFIDNSKLEIYLSKKAQEKYPSILAFHLATITQRDNQNASFCVQPPPETPQKPTPPFVKFYLNPKEKCLLSIKPAKLT